MCSKDLRFVKKKNDRRNVYRGTYRFLTLEKLEFTNISEKIYVHVHI